MAVAEAYYANGMKKDGTTSIEQISSVYGAQARWRRRKGGEIQTAFPPPAVKRVLCAKSLHELECSQTPTAVVRISPQAVVVSVDPRRVYVKDPKDVKHGCVRATKKGPNGEEWAWYQCTINGGRAGRDLGALELAKAVEALGAGEILLNCIDEDGQGNGFDLDLVRQVSSAVRIPVIASSGAGKPGHFTEVFNGTECSAALAAGIFHRKEARVGVCESHRGLVPAANGVRGRGGCGAELVCVCAVSVSLAGVDRGGEGEHGEEWAADEADGGGGDRVRRRV